MNATRWLFCGIGGLTFALTSCSGSKPPPQTTATAPPAPAPRVETNPRVLILGKWVNAQNETIEFAKDGTMSVPGLSPGEYKFLDDQTIEYEQKLALKQQKTKAKIKVSKDEMTLDIVDSKSRPDAADEWSPSPDDLERKGKQEKYKRAT